MTRQATAKVRFTGSLLGLSAYTGTDCRVISTLCLDHRGHGGHSGEIPDPPAFSVSSVVQCFSCHNNGCPPTPHLFLIFFTAPRGRKTVPQLLQRPRSALDFEESTLPTSAS